jgi:hypothetical protein
MKFSTFRSPVTGLYSDGLILIPNLLNHPIVHIQWIAGALEVFDDPLAPVRAVRRQASVTDVPGIHSDAHPINTTNNREETKTILGRISWPSIYD